MNRFNLIIIQIVWLAGCSTETSVSPLSDTAQGDVLLVDSKPSLDGSTNSPDTVFSDTQGDAGADGANGCIDDLTFFKESIWQSFMASDCASCHVAGGLAGGSDMVLTPGNDDASLIKNMAMLAPIALDKTQGLSLLLLKPTGEVPHMGGQRFDPESTMYQRFSELVARFETPEVAPIPQKIRPATRPLSTPGRVRCGA